MRADYSGKGFDQLMDAINKIKNNPDDRRIILSAWNPLDLKKMALPPCHMFAQVGLFDIGFLRSYLQRPRTKLTLIVWVDDLCLPICL